MSLADSLKLNREHAEPLHEQLRAQLARAIASGALAEGARLPSTRTLAGDLGINRATAVEAYRRLEAEGLVDRRQGSGTYVCPGRGGRGPLLRPSRAPVLESALGGETRWVVPPGALDLAGLVPHERNYPAGEFADCLQRVMAERGGAALAYGPTAGDPRLREVLAERLSRRGLTADPSRILVVGGAQQGLDLVFRAFLEPGDAVVTESPSYHLALELLRFHRADVQSIPLQYAGRGASRLDHATFDDALDRHRPALAYAMPTFHNPTGLSLDLPSRRHLASACRERGVLVIEDDYEADTRHGGPELPPLAALPEAGEVAYVGTLSKALFPGLRVGWVVGSPDLLDRLAQVKRLSDLSGAVLLQAVAAELIVSGVYDRHLSAAVADGANRMQRMAAALDARLPEGCRVTEPQGGHVLWLEAPASSGRALAERALREGVVVTAGEAFLPPGSRLAAVRVSIARVDSADVEGAASRLARAVAACIEEGQGSPERIVDMEKPVQV